MTLAVYRMDGRGHINTARLERLSKKTKVTPRECIAGVRVKTQVTERTCTSYDAFYMGLITAVRKRP